jgi:hypothetical protein
MDLKPEYVSSTRMSEIKIRKRRRERNIHCRELTMPGGKSRQCIRKAANIISRTARVAVSHG